MSETALGGIGLAVWGDIVLAALSLLLAMWLIRVKAGTHHAETKQTDVDFLEGAKSWESRAETLWGISIKIRASLNDSAIGYLQLLKEIVYSWRMAPNFVRAYPALLGLIEECCNLLARPDLDSATRDMAALIAQNAIDEDFVLLAKAVGEPAKDAQAFLARIVTRLGTVTQTSAIEKLAKAAKRASDQLAPAPKR